MKKIYNLLLLSTLLLFGASNAWAGYGWYSGSMSIGGKTTDCTAWSTDSNNPTDIGVVTNMTITSIAFNVWSDANDRGGANMYFRIWDGGSSQIGADQNLHLGSATTAAGDHDFSISWTGTENLATAVGITLVPGITYYIDMYAKTYGTSGDEWYSNGGANYHAKLTYFGPLTIGSTGWASFSSEYALDFTGTDVTAYIAKAKNETSVTLEQINKVPANTGIVVHAAEGGTYDIPELDGGADATTGNLLVKNLASNDLAATKVVETTTYYNYTLAVVDAVPVFKHSTGEGKLAAGKAYLQTTAAGATSAPSVIRIIDEENNTTSIEAVGAFEEGVKFIQNGKLYIKKNGVVYDMVGAIVK